MTDQTQFLIKAAILESAAITATCATQDDTATAQGIVASAHTADALCWAISVLTAEPLPSVRARVRDRAKAMHLPDPRRPVRAFA